jgi:hypothetical protein
MIKPFLVCLTIVSAVEHFLFVLFAHNGEVGFLMKVATGITFSETLVFLVTFEIASRMDKWLAERKIGKIFTSVIRNGGIACS